MRQPTFEEYLNYQDELERLNAPASEPTPDVDSINEELNTIAEAERYGTASILNRVVDTFESTATRLQAARELLGLLGIDPTDELVQCDEGQYDDHEDDMSAAQQSLYEAFLGTPVLGKYEHTVEDEEDDSEREEDNKLYSYIERTGYQIGFKKGCLTPVSLKRFLAGKAFEYEGSPQDFVVLPL